MIQNRARITAAIVAAAGVLLLAGSPSAANAATTIDGPIDLGTAAPFAVLAASTVTNTGPSVLTGDVGLSPGTSITGFPPAVVTGTVHATDAVAALAQNDLTTAYNVAASLTPIATGLGDLTGSSPTPGVYSGGELSVTGALNLAGTAESVWVFQAASTLTIGSGAIITMSGGASACNVFWQVGSSATLNPGAQFIGTVMADASITAQTAATITGRLLARTGAVTLDTNTITVPTGCNTPPGTVTSSPEITSTAPPAGTVGTDYSHTVTASGTPTPTYTVTSGALPAGLTLDSTTGVISGRPTTPGTSAFAITASNGIAPDSTVNYSITIAAPAAAVVAPLPGSVGGPAEEDRLADSGLEVGPAPAVAVGAVMLGVALYVLARRRRMSRE